MFLGITTGMLLTAFAFSFIKTEDKASRCSETIRMLCGSAVVTIALTVSVNNTATQVLAFGCSVLSFLSGFTYASANCAWLGKATQLAALKKK